MTASNKDRHQDIKKAFYSLNIYFIQRTVLCTKSNKKYNFPQRTPGLVGKSEMKSIIINQNYKRLCPINIPTP